VYAEAGVAAAGAAAAPAPAALAALTLSRRINGTGLHRELTYAVRARVRAPAGAPPPCACAGARRGAAPPRACRLALVQRLEASTYFDLDELREAQRHAARAGRAPVGLRAFAPHIDVERPTSASTQHVVVLWLPVEFDAGAGAGGARAALLPGQPAEVEVTATFAALLHLRYQAVGCDSASAGAADAAAAAAAPWTAIMAPVWGPLRADGSFYFRANASDGDGDGAGAGAGVPRPFVDGCYALAHLPQPTVHLACDDDGGGGGGGGGGGYSECDGGGACAAADALLAAALAGRRGAWTALPPSAAGGASSLPGQRGYSARLTPPLAPVPVGCRDHAAAVSALTASLAVAGALLLSHAALTRASGRHAA
jgi:hypothetical protein